VPTRDPGGVSHRAAFGTIGSLCLLTLVVPIGLVTTRRKATAILVLLTIVVAFGMVSCGGGGSGSTGREGGSSPQTVNVPVVAQAANTQSDMDNQKTVGPVVITLK
jgi:hypothetical protein